MTKGDSMAEGSVGRVRGGRSSRRASSSRSDVIAALYDAHLDEVYRFVFRRCRDHALTQDVVQETFMSAVRSERDPETLTIGWLMTVARHRLFDVLRRRMRFDDKLRLLIDGTLPEAPFDVTERLRVENALNDLSIEYRTVLMLHYVDGYTVPALAEHLGRTSKSIEGLITRARRAFREVLEADGGEIDV